jgi:hypothetical protein
LFPIKDFHGVYRNPTIEHTFDYGGVYMPDEIEYEVVDFQGFICWVELRDGSFIVDPLYLEQFKQIVLQ